MPGGLFGLGGDRTTIATPQVDPNSFQYGGRAGGANAATDAFNKQAGLADGRQGAQIDQSQFNLDRQRQQQAYGQLQGLANGTGPSLAAAQGQIQGQQAANQMASGAASAVGGGANLASARRAAIMGNAQAQGNIANATLMARQAEQMNAINGLNGAASNMTGQSAQMAQSQAQLQQQQNALNDQRNMGYSQLGNKVQEDQLAAQQNQQQLQSQNQLAQQQQASQQAQANQQANQGILGMAGGAANGAAGAIGKLFSDENLKTNVRSLSSESPWDNMRNANQGKLGGDGYGESAGHVNMPDEATDSAIMAHPGEGNAFQIGAASPRGDEANAKIYASKMYYGGGNDRAGGIAFGDEAVYANNAGGGSSLEGGKVGSESDSHIPMGLAGLRSNGGRFFSDERMKKNVSDAQKSQIGNSEPQDMARSLKPVSFEYKPEALRTGLAAPGTNYGIIAQDLEKTPMGKSLVQETPHGKMIDSNKATGALLATVADQQKQLDALKSARSGEDLSRAAYSVMGPSGDRSKMTPEMMQAYKTQQAALGEAQRRDQADAKDQAALDAEIAAKKEAARDGALKLSGGLIAPAVSAVRESPSGRAVVNGALRGLGFPGRVRGK